MAACAAPGAPNARPAGPDAVSAEARTAAAFDRLKADRNSLRAFLTAFPKGGDLHNHLSGAVYAENYLRWAIEDGLCLDLSRPAIVASAPNAEGGAEGCDAARGFPAAADLLAGLEDEALYTRLVDAMSMRNRDLEPVSGHTRFFRSFARFTALPDRRGDMLAEVARRNADQSVYYLELMTGACRSEAAAFGMRRGLADDDPASWAAFRSDLLASLGEVCALRVDAAFDRMAQRADHLMGCEGESPDPGCTVSVRFIAGILRTDPPASVFAQTLMAAHLVAQEPRLVGLTLLAPEDDPVAMRDYSRHMRMVAFAARTAGIDGINLHAGELTGGLVPPEGLRFHIREAVIVAGSRRIGHGTAIAYEADPVALLERMAADGIAVEMNLSSAQGILGVAPEAYPYTLYAAAGVPVVVSTDDEGVSRSSLSEEYRLAVEAFDLSYADLKRLARNALAYNFLTGAPLWRDPNRYTDPAPACADDLGRRVPSGPDCRALLAASPKAREQFRLEALFAGFEARDWASLDR